MNELPKEMQNKVRVEMMQSKTNFATAHATILAKMALNYQR